MAGRTAAPAVDHRRGLSGMLALSAQAALWFLPVTLPVLLWVAWSDLRAMRIPNGCVMALVLIYAVLGPFVLPLADWGWGWAQLGAVLAIGFALNVAGALGAGDAKLAAAMAPFIAAGDIAFFILFLAVVMLAALVTHRAVRAVSLLRGLAPHWTSWQRRDFPLGFALGPALALYLGLAAAMGAG